ncbi:MAG: hypothetical protein K1X79_01650 [Oligoflexia bacterium]|nr:hypothetical protein [Oligoflexia bacterium]
MDGIPLNTAALSYWRATGFTDNDVEQAARDLDDYLVVRFTIGPHREVTPTVSSKVFNSQQGHYVSVIRFITWLVKTVPFELPQGSFIVLLHDGYNDAPTESSKKVPIFAFARTRRSHQVVLMPDTEFIDTSVYLTQRLKVAEHSAAISWSAKHPALFWRGAPNGVYYLHEGWRTHPRIRLCLESKKLNNKMVLDAGLSAINVPDEQMKKAIEAENITANPVPFEQFYNYKHLIDVDGEHCTWQSTFMKLACESTFLKVESENIQWYHDQLKPWVNYIPVLPDLSNLQEILAWMATHDEKCHEIAIAGQATASTIGLHDTVYRFAYDLAQILSARRPS